MATRDEVVAILRSHGLSGHVAARVWTITRTLLRDTRRRNREYSVLLDAKTGSQVGPTLSGSAHRVDVGPQIASMASSGAYAHLHTHPASSSFSDLDAGFLLTWSQVKAIVVAGLDGRWYVMSRSMDERANSPIGVMAAFRAELALFLNGPSVPTSERPHLIWTRIAEPVGLRYDRIGSLEA